ncbi:hypothetical protein ACFYNO_39100 [Kitasatospora sp. NPDC006697]|uniref:hypothetical protein n=1 Tax=Kitasatospora sp. NPDC006697 TaxID=3364020 RepID=UPI0036B217C0
MIRLIRKDTLAGLLRSAAIARHEARIARRELAELRNRHRRLISHLARREPAQVVVVPLPAVAGPDQVSPLTILLLALWHQADLEREAFRTWVTEEPSLVAAAELQARAAEAARRDSP